MRHQQTRHKLSRTASHRKALLANLDLGVVFGSRRRRWAAPLSDWLVVVQTD